MLLTILYQYFHMNQLGIHPYIKVLCQAVSHIIIIVHFHNLYEVQSHQVIHVKYLETSPKSCIFQFLQLILLRILAMYHHMYKGRPNKHLQKLRQALSINIIQAYHQRLYQAQVHLYIQVKHLTTRPQGCNM